MKYRSKHIAEYVVLVLVGGLIRILPLRAALGLGWFFAASTHFIGKINVKRTHERIRGVFGDRYSEKEIRNIAWISWRNLFFNGIDALRFSMLTPKKIQQQPISIWMPKLQEFLKTCEGGFIIATPHMGNWEIAGVSADLAGLPIFAIVRKQKNPLIDGYINKMRQSFNLEILFKDRQIGKTVVDRLKHGKILGILPDIGVRAKGVTVDYLNNQTAIAPGVAQFAQMANCPICPICVRRIGWTQHDAVLLDPIVPDSTIEKKEDQKRMMQELMTAISQEVCKTPEQYFWYNKRWVLNSKGSRA